MTSHGITGHSSNAPPIPQSQLNKLNVLANASARFGTGLPIPQSLAPHTRLSSVPLFPPSDPQISGTFGGQKIARCFAYPPQPSYPTHYARPQHVQGPYPAAFVGVDGSQYPGIFGRGHAPYPQFVAPTMYPPFNFYPGNQLPMGIRTYNKPTDSTKVFPTPQHVLKPPPEALSPTEYRYATSSDIKRQNPLRFVKYRVNSEEKLVRAPPSPAPGDLNSPATPWTGTSPPILSSPSALSTPPTPYTPFIPVEPGKPEWSVLHRRSLDPAHKEMNKQEDLNGLIKLIRRSRTYQEAILWGRMFVKIRMQQQSQEIAILLTKHSMEAPRTAKGRYACHLCGPEEDKSYVYKKHLTRHLADHLAIKGFSCLFCSHSYTRIDVCRRHMMKCRNLTHRLNEALGPEFSNLIRERMFRSSRCSPKETSEPPENTDRSQ